MSASLKKQAANIALVEILFHFTLLIEYQLLDLHSMVHEAVEKMNGAISNLDTEITDTSKKAAQLLHQFQEQLPVEVRIYLEHVATLNKNVLPMIYTLIENLNFEDIQSQRLDHLVKGYRLLNEEVMKFIGKGLDTCSREDIVRFGNFMMKKMRSLYTMSEERNVFDEVFKNYPFKDQ